MNTRAWTKTQEGTAKAWILPKNFDRRMNDHSTSRRRLPVLFAGLLGLALGAVAQRPAHFEHRNSDLVHALELFDKAKFWSCPVRIGARSGSH